MPRIQPVDPATAEGAVKDTLDGLSKALGGHIPNLYATAAHSPVTLRALLDLSGTLRRGHLGAKLREQIAILTADRNGCAYCLSAHSMLGAKAGLSEDDVAGARDARASEARPAAALAFAARVIDMRGHVADADLAALRAAGFDDEAVIEIVANVAMTIFTNLLNNVAQTTVDTPIVTPSKRVV